MQSNNPDGRPKGSGKLNEELITRISDLARVGVDNNTICAVVKIHKSQFYRWLKLANDDEPDSIYTTFRDSLSRSHGLAKTEAIETVRYNAVDKKDWHAARYFLGTRDPAWQEGSKLSLGGQQENPLEFKVWTPDISDMNNDAD